MDTPPIITPPKRPRRHGTRRPSKALREMCAITGDDPEWAFIIEKHTGGTLVLKMKRCNRCARCKLGPSHGPYWWIHRWQRVWGKPRGRTECIYLGRRLPHAVPVFSRATAPLLADGCL